MRFIVMFVTAVCVLFLIKYNYLLAYIHDITLMKVSELFISTENSSLKLRLSPTGKKER